MPTLLVTLKTQAILLSLIIAFEVAAQAGSQPEHGTTIGSAPSGPPSKEPGHDGLSLRETSHRSGVWDGVDVDPETDRVYSLGSMAWSVEDQAWTGQLVCIDGVGKELSKAPISGKQQPPSSLRVARGAASDPVIVLYGRTTKYVYGFDTAGKSLWVNHTGYVNDVVCANPRGLADQEILVATSDQGVARYRLDGTALPNVESPCSYISRMTTVRAREGKCSVPVLKLPRRSLLIAGEGDKKPTEIQTKFDMVEIDAIGGSDGPAIVGLSYAPPLRMESIALTGKVNWDIVDRQVQSYVVSVAGSGSSQLVAVTFKDGSLRIYHALSGKLLYEARVGFWAH
ncbi:MAG TPA: hypothetical protein VHC70_08120, partial [Phycisphaerales bacterium]|nr:hypothetical protein [Phycisphaerales bacterium]